MVKPELHRYKASDKLDPENTGENCDGSHTRPGATNHRSGQIELEIAFTEHYNLYLALTALNIIHIHI